MWSSGSWALKHIDNLKLSYLPDCANCCWRSCWLFFRVKVTKRSPMISDTSRGWPRPWFRRACALSPVEPYTGSFSSLVACWSQPGLVTNSFLFCWRFTIKALCKKSAFSTNAQSRFCASCYWCCPGTSAPGVVHQTVSLYLCSSASNARGESRAREGRRVSSKSPSRVWDRDKGSCWEERKRIVFPRGGVIDLNSKQINDFSQKGKWNKLS